MSQPVVLKLHLWFPKYPIEIIDQWALQRCFYLNGVNGQVPGTNKGKHKLMGHAMVSLKGDPLPIPQKYYGKSSPDGEVESTWASALKLVWPLHKQLWFAFVTNAFGILPDFSDPQAPMGGVKRLFTVRNPAVYEGPSAVEVSRAFTSVTWVKLIDDDSARACLEWVNASPDASDDPRGDRYGFGSACSDWALGALEAAGAVDPDAPISLRTKVFVHENVYEQAGPLPRPAWRLCKEGPYRHEEEILTPTRLNIAMAAQSGWRRV